MRLSLMNTKNRVCFMQRKATKNTRAANAHEKRYHAWVKEQSCCTCGNHGPSIVHHCEGATFKHNKVLVGHWFCIPLCLECDEVITKGSRRKFVEIFAPQSALWSSVISKYIESIMPNIDLWKHLCPAEVIDSIESWGR
jgi:hypothetical protein